MALTYRAISTITVGAGGAANMTFSDIPQTYTDIVVLSSLRTTGANWDGFYAYFNGSNANLTTKYLLGNGSGTGTGSIAGGYAGTVGWNGSTANTFSSSSLYVPNYTSTSVTKVYSVDNAAEDNLTLAYTNIIDGLWNSTSAITSLTLIPGSGSFIQNSTATLYGINNS